MPLWAEELFALIHDLKEQIEMTQADVDAATAAVQANTAELTQVNSAVAELEAWIVANPGAPVSALDLSGLKTAVAADQAAVASTLSTAQADVAALPVVVPPGTNPVAVANTATGVLAPDPVAAAAATNPGALPVDPVNDATAVNATPDPSAEPAPVVADPLPVDPSTDSSTTVDGSTSVSTSAPVE